MPLWNKRREHIQQKAAKAAARSGANTPMAYLNTGRRSEGKDRNERAASRTNGMMQEEKKSQSFERREEGRPLQIPGIQEEDRYPQELTNRFELIELLSMTEDSETILVRERDTDRLCVAKCYLPESPLYDKTEPEGIRKLSTDLLPAFVAEYQSASMRCILWEYIPGKSLAKARRERSFTDREIVQIGIQLCDQMIVLHSQNPPVIHRDIKPENVILRPDGKVSLIDFGIARQSAPAGGAARTSDTVILGTNGYAPPEQYGFAQTDERSDLYSLGVLLSGLKEERASGKRKRTVLDKVLRRCTAFDPAYRYQSAGQLKEALQKADPDWRRRNRMLLLCGMLAGTAALCFGIFFAVRRAQAVPEFAEPLIEEAVRENLHLAQDEPLTKDLLAQVQGIYIVSDRVLPDADAFYPAVNEMYASGGVVHGTVSSLEDLALMPQIREVCIAAEELKDISVLSGCRQLGKVEMKHNYIEDITPLKGLDKLTYVGINDNPVRDLSPLKDCPALAFLDVRDIRNYDPEVFAELGNFDYLDISNPTRSYDYLDGKSILVLKLAWTGLDTLDVLDNITRLEELDISHSNVTDLSKLAMHTGLKRLNFASLEVEDLSVLKELPQLEEVVLSPEMEPLLTPLGEMTFSVRYEG